MRHCFNLMLNYDHTRSAVQAGARMHQPALVGYYAATSAGVRSSYSSAVFTPSAWAIRHKTPIDTPSELTSSGLCQKRYIVAYATRLSRASLPGVWKPLASATSRTLSLIICVSPFNLLFSSISQKYLLSILQKSILTNYLYSDTIAPYRQALHRMERPL